MNKESYETLGAAKAAAEPTFGKNAIYWPSNKVTQSVVKGKAVVKRSAINSVINTYDDTFGKYSESYIVNIAFGLLAGAIAGEIAASVSIGFAETAIASKLTQEGSVMFTKLLQDGASIAGTTSFFKLFSGKESFTSTVRKQLAAHKYENDKITISYQYNYMHGGGSGAYFLHSVTIE